MDIYGQCQWTSFRSGWTRTGQLQRPYPTGKADGRALHRIYKGLDIHLNGLSLIRDERYAPDPSTVIPGMLADGLQVQVGACRRVVLVPYDHLDPAILDGPVWTVGKRYNRKCQFT